MARKGKKRTLLRVCIVNRECTTKKELFLKDTYINYILNKLMIFAAAENIKINLQIIPLFQQKESF